MPKIGKYYYGVGRKRRVLYIDEFGDEYYASKPEDKTKTVSVSLPKSLLAIVDEDREDIARSRFLRHILEDVYDVERDQLTK